MDMNSDPMVSAVEEVTLVAEELRALRNKVKQYGEASKRLSEFGDILNELNGSVSKIQHAFTAVFEQAEKTSGKIDSANQTVEELVTSVPEIIKRIESADVSKTIDRFNGSMGQLGSLLETHQKTVSEVVARFSDERATQAAIVDDIRILSEKVLASVSNLSSEVGDLHGSSSHQLQKLDALSNVVSSELSPKIRGGLESISELKGMVKDIQSGSNKSTDVMADFCAKMLREISSLREDVKVDKKILETQGQTLLLHGLLLEDISKKKRGLFG